MIMNSALKLVYERLLNKSHHQYRTDLEIGIIDKANEHRTEIIKIIEQYEKMLKDNKFKLIFGIRPDEIYETVEIGKKVDPSTSFKINVNIAELLGNQYYIHTKFGKNDITFTTPADKFIQNNEEMEIVINKRKYHIFDSVTKKIIY